MSTSSVGSKSVNRSSSRYRLRSRCFCGDAVGRWTSSTLRNPGRRFIGCPNFQDEEKACHYYAFVDPPLPNQWYKDMLFKYINSSTQFEEEEICGEYAPRAESGIVSEDPQHQPVVHEAVVQEEVMPPVVKHVNEASDGGILVSWKIWLMVGLFVVVWFIVV